MKCWNCGAEIDDDSLFCTTCGKEQQKKEESPKLKQERRDQEEQKKKHFPVIIGICAVVLVVGVSWFLKKDDSKKNAQIGQQTNEGQTDVFIQKRQADTFVQETEELKGYVWVVEPEIEADDIYYPVENSETMMLGGKSHVRTLNELNRQVDNPNAVINKDSALGVIQMDGELAAELEYKQIEGYGRNYMMTRIVPISTEDYGENWDLFWLLEDGEIIADVGVGSAAYYLYYYCDGLHHTYEGQEFFWEEPEMAIPVQQTDIMYNAENFNGWNESLAGKYAVFKEGTAVTEFIYDECGSCSEGLLAVSVNGKWGYINEVGETVIPIEYDASWAQYQDRWDYYGGEKDFCYAASGGYVPLVRGGEWELRDLTGKLVISSGIFEAIRPVYDGKCWVKKDGKWGVIGLEGEEYTENFAESELHTEEEIQREAETVYVPETESEEVMTFSQVLADDEIEAEVLRIRAIFTEQMEKCSNQLYERVPMLDGYVAWFEDGVLRTITTSSDVTSENYERIFTYENGKLIFAYFVDDGNQSRLYYKDDNLFRWSYPETTQIQDNNFSNPDFVANGLYGINVGYELYNLATGHW